MDELTDEQIAAHPALQSVGWVHLCKLGTVGEAERGWDGGWEEGSGQASLMRRLIRRIFVEGYETGRDAADASWSGRQQGDG